MRPTPREMPALRRVAACRPPIAVEDGRWGKCYLTDISSRTCDTMYRCMGHGPHGDGPLVRRFEDGSAREWGHHDSRAGRRRKNRAPKGSRWLSVPIQWAEDAIAGTLPPDDDGGPATDEDMARLRAAAKALGHYVGR